MRRCGVLGVCVYLGWSDCLLMGKTLVLRMDCVYFPLCDIDSAAVVLFYQRARLSPAPSSHEGRCGNPSLFACIFVLAPRKHR